MLAKLASKETNLTIRERNTTTSNRQIGFRRYLRRNPAIHTIQNAGLVSSNIDGMVEVFS